MASPELGFSPEERWQIATALEAISPSDQERIGQLLEAISLESQSKVEWVRCLNSEILELRRQMVEAAGGLIRADVLEWSENRSSTVSCLLSTRRAELARAIGFSLSYSFPWEG